MALSHVGSITISPGIFFCLYTAQSQSCVQVGDKSDMSTVDRELFQFRCVVAQGNKHCEKIINVGGNKPVFMVMEHLIWQCCFASRQ